MWFFATRRGEGGAILPVFSPVCRQPAPGGAPLWMKMAAGVTLERMRRAHKADTIYLRFSWQGIRPKPSVRTGPKIGPNPCVTGFARLAARLRRLEEREPGPRGVGLDPPVEAGAAAGVTGAAVAADLDEGEKGVLVAVDPHLDEPLDLP